MNNNMPALSRNLRFVYFAARGLVAHMLDTRGHTQAHLSCCYVQQRKQARKKVSAGLRRILRELIQLSLQYRER